MDKQGKDIHQLLVKTLAGDKVAYRDFLIVITPLVESIAHKAFKKDDVPDIVQEIFLSIHKSLPTFDPTKPVKPWIVAIANRRVVDYIRKVSTRNEKEVLTEDGDVTFFPDDTNVLSEVEMPAILDLVPEDTKMAILLTKYEGHSTEEAAKILGLNNNALRTRISRGLSLIKKKIEEGYLDE